MRAIVVGLLMLGASGAGGCAALTNPVADGVPVRRLPEEVLGRSKADLKPIPLTLLRQKENPNYRLDKGDVLAIVADEVIAPSTVQPPVRLPDAQNNLAATGYPIPVSEDGTISIPRVPPINVKGKTVPEAEQLVKDTLIKSEVLKPAARISVQLMQKRKYQVMVIREDTTPVPIQSGNAILGTNKRGNGFTLSLQQGENDVLRALNATGGPPGLDAKNEVVIMRGQYDPSTPNYNLADIRQVSGSSSVTRIPMRVYPEQPLTIQESDIVLKDGDILLIEARDTEVYYTAGLIGAGQFVLPRDTDLDVIQAIAQVRGPLVNGGFSQNQFVPQSVGTGIGSPSPSLCTVLRQLPGKQQIPIRVDLNRAFIDPRERLLIQPGDIIVLQERSGEAIGRYLSQTLRLSTSLEILRGGSLTSNGTSTNP
jgi:protein involved in polysaccharide export with SLBB domain